MNVLSYIVLIVCTITTIMTFTGGWGNQPLFLILVFLFGYPVLLILRIVESVLSGNESNSYSNRTFRSPDVTPTHNPTPINTAVLTKDGNAWVCKECSEENPLSSSTCKGCGAYK